MSPVWIWNIVPNALFLRRKTFNLIGKIMKKYLFIVMLAASLPQLMKAQDVVEGWLPMLEEGRQWLGMDLKIPGDGGEYRNALGRSYAIGALIEFFIDGEEEYNEHIYKKLVQKGGLLNVTGTSLLRQEGARIYAATEGGESLVYDFSLNEGDIFVIDKECDMNLRVVKVENIILEDTERRCLWMQTCYTDPNTVSAYNVDDIWVEGLGSIVFGPSAGYLDLWMTGSGSCLNLCKQNNQILFSSEDSQQFSEIVTGVETVDNQRDIPCTLYDLQGRRLSREPEHGVFFRDGRKYVK